MISGLNSLLVNKMTDLYSLKKAKQNALILSMYIRYIYMKVSFMYITIPAIDTLRFFYKTLAVHYFSIVNCAI